MDIVYLFRVLLKKKWIILGAALLAAGLVFYFTRNQPKQYRSSAQIATGYTTDIIRVKDVDQNYFDIENKFNNVIVTFTSPVVLSLLSYNLILHDLNNPAAPFHQLTEKEKNSILVKGINLEEAKKVYKNKFDSMST